MESNAPNSSNQDQQRNKSVMTSDQIQKLVQSINPGEKLDAQVEQFLLQIADDFVDNVASYSCMLAKHRNSNTLEVKDVALHLEKHWNMEVAGFSEGAVRPIRRTQMSAQHRTRLDIVNKSMVKDANRTQRKAMKRKRD